MISVSRKRFRNHHPKIGTTGLATNMGTLRINASDVILTRIKEKVGLVEHPIYLFGLKDREEYQLSVSSNLMDSVREFLMLNGLDWKVTEGIGSNRLGISQALRKECLPGILKLIRNITCVRESVAV